MAIVTKRFRDNFEAFAAHRVASGALSVSEMEEFRALVRKDLEPGPDQIRASVDCLVVAGVKIPATIDDAEERYRLWDEFFSAEAEDIARMACEQQAMQNAALIMRQSAEGE